MRKFGTVLAAALAFAASSIMVAAPANAVDAIAWHPCTERPDDASLSCATVNVPVDWAHPDGQKFPLAIAKHAATDQAHKTGPLVVNPGGPGGSGVDFAQSAGSYFSPQVLSKFDVIGFDPRGVARSNPVKCSSDLVAAKPFAVPSTQAQYDKLLAYNRKLGNNCRANTGPVFDHLDTGSVARDIDAIREALGAQQISYYGVSYGTLIGQTYAELFPGRSRAVAVDSNMNHSIGTRDFLATEAITDEDSFMQFVQWCDRSTDCALHGKGVNAIWHDLQRKADAGKLVAPDTGEKLTWWNLSQMAVGSFYGPSWTNLANQILALHEQKPAEMSARRSAGLVESPTSAIFCQDWSLPVHSFAQLRDYYNENKSLAPNMRTSPLGWGVATSCLNWPSKVNFPQHELDVHTKTPLLVANSQHDPATPYSWAVGDKAQLGSKGRLLTYEGWGHGIYKHSECTSGAIDRYLLDKELPLPGAHCPAVEPKPDELSTQQQTPRITF